MARLDAETLDLILSTLKKYAALKLTPEYLIQLDHEDRFPYEILQELYDPEQLDLQLLFIPEEYGGLGGGAYDIYRVAELMAAIGGLAGVGKFVRDEIKSGYLPLTLSLVTMIHYLTQSSTSHPDLSTGCVPAGLLTPAEQAFYDGLKYDGLKSDKRRHDWLLGRWTGKRLVRRAIGNGIPLDGIEILAADNGAPVVSIQYSVSWGSSPLATTHFQLPTVTLSISHSANRAFCGVAQGDGIPFGVDIEWIENRTETFVRDYFVLDEIALVEGTSPPLRAGMVTAIWSAKEAALKAIRVGLSADTFSVHCLPRGDGWKSWFPVEIVWDEDKLKHPAHALSSWWRIEDGFVLTVATAQMR